MGLGCAPLEGEIPTGQGGSTHDARLRVSLLDVHVGGGEIPLGWGSKKYEAGPGVSQVKIQCNAAALTGWSGGVGLRMT